MLENDIATKVIGCAIEVHKALGPGLLESAYRECLSYDLVELGLKVEKEKEMPIKYKKIRINHGYRMDLLVEDKVAIEIKTVEFLTEVHMAQLLTYLKFGGYKLGLLVNFHSSVLRSGIKRIIN